MSRDILFMLHPRFTSEEGVCQFCPDTMMVEGVLACFPDLRTRLDVRYVDFPKPRKSIIDVVGEAKQSAPMLVQTGENGRIAIDDLQEILRVFVRDYGISQPRGMM